MKNVEKKFDFQNKIQILIIRAVFPSISLILGSAPAAIKAFIAFKLSTKLAKFILKNSTL